MRTRISQATTVAALVALATTAHAVINVSAGGNINTAIAAAAVGEEIVLADGVYAQDVVLNKAVIIRAANAGAATITGSSPLGAVRVQTDGATLRDLNINGSTFVGIGIEAPGTLTLDNVSLNGNGVGGSNNDDRSGLFLNSGVGAVTLITLNSDFTDNKGRGLTFAGGNTVTWNDTASAVTLNDEVGVLVDCPLAITFSGTSISSNQTSGIVSFYGISGTVQNGTFNSNGNRGFELLPVAGQVNSLTFTNSSFNGNTAQGLILDQAGGGARPNQSLTLNNCSIQNNGGANPALFVGGVYTFNGGTISGNAEGLGRFFWPDASGTTITLDGVSITGNTGFGVRVDVSEATNLIINNCTITGNGGEGAVQHLGDVARTTTITRSTLGIGTGNLAALVIAGRSTASITNTILTAETATAAPEARGLALIASGAGAPTATLDHCTVIGPGSTTPAWRGLEIKNDLNAQAAGQDAVATVKNSIITRWGTGIQLFDDGTGVAQPVFNGDNNLYFANAVNEGADDDSDLAGGPEGGVFNVTDTITGDPLLNASYVPQAGSAAINAADATSTLTVDRVGNARPGGAGNDVGALEAVTSVEDWMML